MTTIKKRRIEITAYQCQQLFGVPSGFICPVCQRPSELLTLRQTGDLTRVTVSSVRRWLGKGLIHGTRTPGGRHRVCRTSLWDAQTRPTAEEKQFTGNSHGVGVRDEVYDQDPNLLAMCLKAAKSALTVGKEEPFISEE